MAGRYRKHEGDTLSPLAVNRAHRPMPVSPATARTPRPHVETGLVDVDDKGRDLSNFEEPRRKIMTSRLHIGFVSVGKMATVKLTGITRM